MKRIPPRSVANDSIVSRIFLLLITAAIITRCYRYHSQFTYFLQISSWGLENRKSLRASRKGSPFVRFSATVSMLKGSQELHMKHVHSACHVLCAKTRFYVIIHSIFDCQRVFHNSAIKRLYIAVSSCFKVFFVSNLGSSAYLRNLAWDSFFNSLSIWVYLQLCFMSLYQF